MTVTVDIQAQGFEQVTAKLKELRDVLGSRITGVELKSVPRKDSAEPDNADIIDYLVDGGRDFYGREGMSAADVERISVAFCRKLTESLETRDISLASQITMKEGDVRKQTEAAASEALREAMRAYMQVVIDNIQGARSASGGSLKKPQLSEAYRDKKVKDHGFDYPIGVATGQLLSNLNPAATGGKRGNIQIVRSK